MTKCEQLFEGDNLRIHPLKNSTKGISATQRWLVTGAADETEALSAIKSHIFKNKLKRYLGLVLESFSVVERLAMDKWKIDVNYREPTLSEPEENDREEDPEEVTTFSSSSTTIHVTHSLATKHKYARPNGASAGTAPDYKGAICVAGSEVNGTDINVSTVTMTITHYFKKSKFSTNLRNKILSAGNCVNSDSFRGFKPGELLFTNADIAPHMDHGEEYVRVDYKFAYSPNEADVKLADWTGPAIRKDGWDFMWVQFEADKGTGRLYPKFVYVEQVYNTCQFSGLGIKAAG